MVIKVLTVLERFFLSRYRLPYEYITYNGRIFFKKFVINYTAFTSVMQCTRSRTVYFNVCVRFKVLPYFCVKDWDRR